jgi:hypothetical protein
VDITTLKDGADLDYDWNDVDGLDNFSNDFENQSSEAAQEVLEAYGPLVVQYAEYLTPVRTGALQGSYEFTVTGGWTTNGVSVTTGDDGGVLSLMIWNEMYYFQFVEYGTIKMYPRMMLQQAIAYYEPEITEAVAEAMGDNGDEGGTGSEPLEPDSGGPDLSGLGTGLGIAAIAGASIGLAMIPKKKKGPKYEKPTRLRKFP